MPLKALAINCSLKASSSSERSSTDVMLGLLREDLRYRDCESTVLRAADYNIKPGVTSDEGEGDDWPHIRRQILDSDILIIGTPVWLGQPSSICKRVLERMDAFLAETDDEGRMVSYSRVAAVAIVGNEDGAHFCSAAIYQALNDVGFSLAANAVTYWVGEAMASRDFKHLDATPTKVVETSKLVARNVVHLAELLKANAYPGKERNLE
ncbi:flavodoxin family protein [Limoniibacter endophyticus]|uniref:NADPH-dependent FMN reductase-like domain-containing protein n=1 Tax=Limoniibacter endophyticus TaxID=1565040 RepID=A0A8J3GIJ1_9HYPH|nr:NAD(P)H-dependent oxidoreductase [Limoniibacter endophyticus]GHC77706.1 hypothetical protein GCM10010136_29110 [Limoniibacter endophyticus]